MKKTIRERLNGWVDFTFTFSSSTRNGQALTPTDALDAQCFRLISVMVRFQTFRVKGRVCLERFIGKIYKRVELVVPEAIKIGMREVGL